MCEHTPGTHAKKALLINSGAEAVENAVKIARYHTGRDGVITFDRGFHGRTLLTMSLTSRHKPYKTGFGPFAPEVYRLPYPYPYRSPFHSSDEAEECQRALEHLDNVLMVEGSQTVAAILIETVIGTNGILVPPRPPVR